MNTRATVRRAAVFAASAALIAFGAGAANASQPDGGIRAGTSGPFAGIGVINDTGNGQKASRTVDLEEKAVYELKVKNTSNGACLTEIFEEDSSATGAGTVQWASRYRNDKGKNISTEFLSHSYATTIKPGKSKAITVTTRILLGEPGARVNYVYGARCAESNEDDFVKTVTKRGNS
jgi:hypothetical protein